ncbi:hypothetical protein G3576_04065 [Roseomonas stagni]|uniref:DUF3592 domain-containing protein n=1 Tax=Falsiroseomonas algicola TaxID=2716930 RepID=A0A6M1LFN4_9PROT|nr:hypothetical protein [Falsiroseomonas algicola]NGM19178.1 hypothetical protein [Falsiroseomonas algicola]
MTDQPPPARYLAHRRLVPADRREAIQRIVGSLGFFLLFLAISGLPGERWIAITWPRVEATVTSAVPGGELEKQGYPFHVMLEATLPDGRRIAPPAPVTLYSSTLDPSARQPYGEGRRRPPQPGETVPAYADARGAGTLLPIENMKKVGLAIILGLFVSFNIGISVWRLQNPP